MPTSHVAADQAVYIPSPSIPPCSGEHQIHSRQITLVESYIRKCTEFISSTFTQPLETRQPVCGQKADEVIRILLNRDFNYQSRGRVAHLLPQLRASIGTALDGTGQVPVYFLYHGGYRSSADHDSSLLNFSPDVTELLLLYQIARLHHRLKAIGVDGLRFSIVINNGVASYTNGISYQDTGGYVQRLRSLIQTLHASDHVSVLAQSELGSFEEKMNTAPVTGKKEITTTEHAIVERFLGRSCSVEEASQRAAIYEKAEAVWGAEIKSIVESHSGLFCRQVAHPECLSFRPFPGGAIRVQNGSVGFRISGDQLVPVLVTPASQTRAIPIPLSHDSTVPSLRPDGGL